MRILFATEPGREPDVRQRIESALDTGQFGAPDGVVTRWRVVSQSRSSVTADEADHAARL